MKIGTKTLLFGAHQFLIHPICCIIAWKKLFNQWPNWKEIICIFIHDIGYWGKDNLDGDEGKEHPELGARIAGKLFGHEYRELCAGHSRSYAKKYNIKKSKLCAADKYGALMPPAWLYLFLTTLTGELDEYRMNAITRSNGEGFIPLSTPNIFWYETIKRLLICEAYKIVNQN